MGLNVFRINKLVPDQLNLNSLRILLCLWVVIFKLGIELAMPKLKNMYIIKKNSVDEGRVYLSTYLGHVLVLKLPKSISGWNDRFFYVLGNLGYNKQDLETSYSLEVSYILIAFFERFYFQHSKNLVEKHSQS